jgi:hypothetical protein
MGNDEVLMPEFRPTDDAPFGSAQIAPSVRDTMLLGLLLLAVAAAEARAGERPASSGLESGANVDAELPRAPVALRAGVAAPWDTREGTPSAGKTSGGAYAGPAPAVKPGGADLDSAVFSIPADGGLPRYSATDFSPRRRNLLDPDPKDLDSAAPMLGGTTMWQRMSDFRSHDRVRVLTLWESSGGAVSLQAGRRGDPSLQWTSSTMNRGGATRGLLDKLFSVSIAGAGQTLRSVTRASGAAQARPGGSSTLDLK